MILLALLPLIIVSLIIFQKTQSNFRESILNTAVLWSVLIVVLTEILSLFNAISFKNLSAFWLVTNIVCIRFFYLTYKKTKFGKLRQIFEHPKLTPSEWIVLGGVILFASTCSIIAFIAPPNNWDSLTYHMSRVAHWAQNQNVKFYQTSIIRQLTLNPFAEFIILQFQVLTSSDRWANFVQYFSMLGSLLGTSLIASKLGANRLTQLMTAAIVISIPMGIAQSTSTQNDYAASFLMICIVYNTIKLKNDFNWKTVFYLGSSLGLGFLTKGTVYLYALPFIIWILFSFKQKPSIDRLKVLLLLFVLTCAINSGHYLRNYSFSGSILSGNVLPKVMNQRHGLDVLGSNLLRNTALHWAAFSNSICERLTQGVVQAHKIVGLDAADPQTTYSSEFIIQKSLAEDTSGNFRHFILGVLSLIFYFIYLKRFKDNQILKGYLLALLSSFFIFCWLIKWQPWHSRLHLPLFVLAAPWIAIVLSNKFKDKWILLISIFLLLTSIPWLLRNPARRMQSSKKATIFNTSRIDQYFANNPDIKAPYKVALSTIASSECQNIGVAIGEDSWEYPLWAILQFEHNSNKRIEHVNVQNISQKYKTSNFSPCLIMTDQRIQKDTDLIINNKTFRPIHADLISVLSALTQQ